ncbi:MAG: hypothetical protein RBR77_14740 [Thauera sp.]|jgi:hypothetical protein|nr:hypothetical protein [Thauera sp.]
MTHPSTRSSPRSGANRQPAPAAKPTPGSRLAPLLLGLGVALPSFAQAATWLVGPDTPYPRISDVCRQARDGDTIDILPGEYRADVCVWRQKQLTLRGIGERPVLIADGKIAEGKAIWVMRNGNFLVDNIEFRGARAKGGNGAGIRHEHGHLEVRNSHFIDNQMGLLTANFDDTELIVRDSLFANAPRQQSPLPHLLYVGRIKRFEISGSRFHQGHYGHLIKSRARRNDIRYNLLYDSAGGEASYEIDLPNGGHSVIIGNIIGQSASTQNPAVIAYGAEGPIWPDSALYLAHNTLLSDRLSGTWFLRTFTDKLPADTRIIGVNNLSVGIGAFTLTASGEFSGNIPLPPGALHDPATLDFRPRGASLLRSLSSSAGEIDGIDLRPSAEFSLPLGTRPLPPDQVLLPGAVQTID